MLFAFVGIYTSTCTILETCLTIGYALALGTKQVVFTRVATFSAVFGIGLHIDTFSRTIDLTLWTDAFSCGTTFALRAGHSTLSAVLVLFLKIYASAFTHLKTRGTSCICALSFFANFAVLATLLAHSTMFWV